ncbi:MAG: TRAP transporter small permease [Candidatus Accumulibacter sp.]|jgi:TRAP-type C4-dicarboxylate transport system permease small subunit|nr:TRAP transporter small permease [Accumulibacter sp.]
MKEAVQTLEKCLEFVLRWACILLFSALVILVVYQVAQRQVLIPVGLMKTGFAWTEAMGRYVFIWLGLLGAAYVIGENDDVAIDFLVRRFPAAVARIVECVAHALVAFFAVWVMLYGGWRYVSKTWDQTVELLPFSQGQLYSVLLISGALIALYSLIHFGRAIVRKVEIRNEDDIDISGLQDEGI